MKRAISVFCGISRVLVGLWALSAHADFPTLSETAIHFDQAQWTATPTSAPRGGYPFSAVSLPDWRADERVLDRKPDATPAQRRRMHHWYAVTFRLPDFPQDALALYLPRYQDRLTVTVNGDEVWRSFPDHQAGSRWNEPLWVVVPARVWRMGVNEVVLRVHSPYFGQPLVGSLWVGPPDTLLADYRSERFWRLTAPRVVAWLLVGIGVFALGIWLVHPREKLHLLLGLASVCFAVRQLHYVVFDPLLSMAVHWWLAVVSLPWAILMIFLFASRYYAVRYPRVERLLWAYAMVITLITTR